MIVSEFKLLIAEGEGLTVEFKKKYTTKIDRDMFSRMDKAERVGTGIK